MTIKELEILLQKKGLANSLSKNGEYWRERFEVLENTANNKGIEYVKNTSKIYQRAINETEKEISKWYTRYASAEGISYQEAQKQLNANELKEFRMSVEEYIEKGKTLGVSQKWAKELERASTKAHISRLEALKLQMQQQAEIVTAQKSTEIKDLMKDIYSDSFYKTAFEVQKGIGVASHFAKLDKKTIEKVLSKPWTADGSNFSDRVWGSHRAQLVSKLHEELSLNIIQGKGSKDLIKKISNTFEVDKKRAATLVYTEKAYFHSLAQLDSFKELGVEEFEIVATLDSKTSEICREMDGKHFKLKDFLVGITAPPFHPRCRTVTCPYFNDEFTIDEQRAARDENGKYYTVPSNMTYKDWKKNFVDNKDDTLKNVIDIPKIKIAPCGEEKTFKKYSNDEIMDFANENEKIINKHISKETKWSGNIRIDKSRSYKDWSCDIVISEETSPMVILHEQLHARSASYITKNKYRPLRTIEEISTQFLTQEICNKELIEIIDSAYDDYVEMLRELNKIANLYDDDYTFAIELYNQPLDFRNDWLESKVYDKLKIDFDIDKMLKFNEIMNILRLETPPWILKK